MKENTYDNLYLSGLWSFNFRPNLLISPTEQIYNKIFSNSQLLNVHIRIYIRSCMVWFGPNLRSCSSQSKLGCKLTQPIFGSAKSTQLQALKRLLVKLSRPVIYHFAACRLCGPYKYIARVSTLGISR